MTEKTAKQETAIPPVGKQDIQVVRWGQMMLSAEDYQFEEGTEQGPVHEYAVIVCHSRKIKDLTVTVPEYMALVQRVQAGMTVKQVQEKYRKERAKKQEAAQKRAQVAPILNATGTPVGQKPTLVKPPVKKVIKPN